MSVLPTIKLYKQVAGVGGLLRTLRARSKGTYLVEKVESSLHKHPASLRMPSTDIFTYEQVFHRKDYEFEVENEPRTIVDAGANIGLASMFMADRFPDAKIYAIEPEVSNFRLLEENVAAYENVFPIHAALWKENGLIDIVDPGFGYWAFMSREEQKSGDDDGLSGEFCHKVRAVTVDKLMEEVGLESIDILKLDIEGAERELFEDPAAWINRVDSMIVELHEFMKPGSYRSFYNGSNGFTDEWFQGENVFLTRGEHLVKPEVTSMRSFVTGEDYATTN